MTERPRLRKRPLEADAATIARAADEIDRGLRDDRLLIRGSGSPD
jgi:hypothetical protein